MSDVAARSGCCLKPVRVPGLPPRIEIHRGDLALGRAPSNDVVVPGETFPQVSAHHARLTLGTEAVLLEDLGSRNGTFVNGDRIESRRLRDGDVFQLGALGPQFVFEVAAGESATVMVDGSALPRAARRDPSQTTLVRLKHALGIPEHSNVREFMQSHERRSRKGMVLAALGAAAIGTIAAVWAMRGNGDMHRLEQLNVELQAQLVAASQAFQQQRDAWDGQKKRLEQERASLVQRIQQVADREQTSSTELARLRESLDDTNRSLERFNPLSVEQARLAGIGRVQRAVVFVETKLRFRSSKTQRLLRRRSSDAAEDAMTFDEAGDVVERESSGSGFCIAGDGHIISNAHVVRPRGCDQPIELDSDEMLRPELVHEVVFSGSDQRHGAQVVQVLETGDEDLALLRIEPFPGMPHLEDFATEVTPPAPGAEVYLHGFPLGKMAIQEGDKVIASSFRGILSRAVSTWLQVDAAVHPGNSGGPLTDSSGRVIGVVCRVQRIPEGPLAPDMGYAIPITAVGRLWPPQKGK